MTTRLRTYLETFYVITPPGSLMAMLTKHLREEGTGNATLRFRTLMGLA